MQDFVTSDKHIAKCFKVKTVKVENNPSSSRPFC